MKRMINWFRYVTTESKLATVARISWYVHGIVSILFAYCFSLVWNMFGEDGLFIGITIAMLFYLCKEIGDFWRYGMEGRLREQDSDGVTRINDGFGDFCAPFAAWLIELVHWAAQ